MRAADPWPVSRRRVARARNTWRALTSMGTALVLLFLLALGGDARRAAAAAQPQRGKVDEYIAEHPIIGPWLDRLQAFDVFSSFWFTAIYVLLFISLVGCLTPRLDRARPQPACGAGARSAQPGPAAQARRGADHRRPAGAGDGHRRSDCAAGARPSGSTTDTVESLPRRATCASSATWSSTSRCWACWSRWPSASCSATRATSSSSPTAGRGSARRPRRRSTRSAPATPSTARRCTRSACGSTTSRPTTCPTGRRSRSPPTSTTRPVTT